MIEQQPVEEKRSRTVQAVGIAQRPGGGYRVVLVELPDDSPHVVVIEPRAPRENAYQVAQFQLEKMFHAAIRKKGSTT